MRSDMKGWRERRRARTHRLILLGGLVDKAGLLPLLGENDPDAALLGGLLTLRALLVEGDAGGALMRWRRRGQRALRGASEIDL